MTQTRYILQIQSTGEILRAEFSDKSMLVWQNKWCRKLPKYKRTNPTVRQAILEGDIITGWDNYDEIAQQVSLEELAGVCKRVFRGYDKWTDSK